MSSNAPNQSSPLAQPPHIRLNSGNSEVPTQGSLKSRPPPLGGTDPNGGRSLIPQRPQTAPQNQQATPGTPSTPAFYAAGLQPSAERLLSPSGKPSRTRRFRDDDANGSPDPFADSRRTSWSSEGGSRDSRIYSPGPYDDSRAPSRAGSDDENLNTQTVSEKYNILPSAGLLLFPEDVEKDDWLHNPDPNDKDGNSCCDVFTKRGIVNMGGLVLMAGGILALFIALPLTYVLSPRIIFLIANLFESILVQKIHPDTNPCATTPNCIPGISNVPLLKTTRRGMIDPDTPKSAMTKTGVDGSTLNLVVSVQL